MKKKITPEGPRFAINNNTCMCVYFKYAMRTFPTETVWNYFEETQQQRSSQT